MVFYSAIPLKSVGEDIFRSLTSFDDFLDPNLFLFMRPQSVFLPKLFAWFYPQPGLCFFLYDVFSIWGPPPYDINFSFDTP